jgi:hypothetical protein
VVSRFDLYALLASAREVSHLHCGFGIYGKAYDLRIGIGCGIDLIYLLEDGISGWDLFLGLLLATFIGEYPISLSLVPMVVTVGNS